MKWYNKIILFFTVIAAIGLMLSYLAMYMSPAKFWYIAYFGLGYLPVVIVNFIFLLYWLFAKRRVFYILLVLFLVGLNAHRHSFAFNFQGDEDKIAEDTSSPSVSPVKILSWNVKGFDVYDPKEPYKNRDAIIETIAEAKADIVCLQEFNTYQNDSPEKSNLNEIMKATGLTHYYYYKAYENRKKTRSFGVIILSRFEIKDSGLVPYANTSELNSTIYADMDINGKIIRVFAAHLQSTQLTHRDLEFIEPSQDNDNTSFDKDRVMNKLNSAFSMRSAQADSVHEAVLASPYPVVLCGDFNDTPVSFVYQTIAEDMDDAFLQKGFGIGATFVAFPVLRIDYFLFSEDDFDILHYRKIKTRTSDHFPSVTTFSVK